MENSEPQSQTNVATQNNSTPRSLHTPGPWTLFYDRIAAPCYEHPRCEKTIAWLRPEGGVLQCSHNGDGTSLCLNAHIIAAAPELLEALRLVLDCDYDDERKIKDVPAIAAAIAKAEGASSVHSA